ncbi:MAG TPA: hypothetical protein PKD91_08015 [Bacteroidia bacterium]|nr:hypothetical protein [Bacteroidia bacterium]
MYSKLFTGLIGGLIFLPAICNSTNLPSNPTLGTASLSNGLWSVLNNPAGLPGDGKFATGIYHDRTFLMKELSTSTFAISLPVKTTGAFGIGYRQFGYKLYKERDVGLCYAMKFGSAVTAGVRFDYFSTRFGNDYGGAYAFSGSAGLLIQLTRELRSGFYLHNPQRAKFSGNTNEKTPSLVSGGLQWNFGKHAELNFGVEKKSNEKERLQCGFRYTMSDQVGLYGGVSSGKDAFHFGFQFRLGNLYFDIASGYHQLIGFSPRFSLIFKSK